MTPYPHFTVQKQGDLWSVCAFVGLEQPLDSRPLLGNQHLIGGDPALILWQCPAEIQRLAQQMVERQQRSGLAEETWVILHPEYSGHDSDAVYQIILRPAPGGKLQLITGCWGRHYPAPRQAELAQAFGVPDGVNPDFAIIKGWQITKWTWTAAKNVEQANFLHVAGPQGESPRPGREYRQKN